MIRCPDCKMLNRLGSIHCGFCGHLLTDKEGASKEPGFKAPKLASGDSGEGDEFAEVAAPSAPGRQTMFGMRAEASGSPSAEASKTIVGMPAVKMEEGAAAPPGLPGRRASVSAELTRSERPPAAARVVVSGVAMDALADTPPPDQASGPPRPPRRRRQSQTLFGMRAAELHLGLAESDTGELPVAAPKLKEAFPALSDTAERRAISQGVTASERPSKAFVRHPSGARIEALAPLKGTGEAFADTAVIKAVDPNDPAMREAIERAQAETVARVGPMGSAPPGPAATSSPVADIGVDEVPLRDDDPTQRSLPAVPLADEALGGLGAAESPQRSSAPVAPERVPAATTAAVSAAVEPSSRLRPVLFVGGLSLLAASFFPWATSIWRRADIWVELGPIVLGAVGLALVVPRRVPPGLLFVVGLLAVTVGAFQFIEVGLPGSGAGTMAFVRFGLVVGGALLLAVAGALASGGRASRSNPSPPQLPG